MVKKIWIFSSKNEKFQNLIQHPFSRWVQFCEIQRLQGAVKNFLGVEDICSGYLEGPPWSGLSNAPTFMIIWWVYQKILRNFEFLVKKNLPRYLFGSHFSSFQKIFLWPEWKLGFNPICTTRIWCQFCRRHYCADNGKLDQGTHTISKMIKLGYTCMCLKQRTTSYIPSHNTSRQ